VSNPVKHHYVAQHVLRRFCDPQGILWTYDKQKNRIYPGSPESQARGKHFYSFLARDGSRNNTTIEVEIFGKIDSNGCAAIQRLLNREEVTNDQGVDFARFAAAQMIRVESYFQRLEQALSPILEESAKRMFAHYKEFKDRVTVRLREKFSDEQIDEFVAGLARGEVQVKANRGWLVTTFLQSLETITRDFCEMKWGFLRSETADDAFLLSDNPLVLADVGEGPPQPLGTKNPNIEVTMPLNPTTVALARWGEGCGHGTINSEYVATVNQRTIEQAHRYVYAPYRSEDLLQRVVESQGKQARTRVVKIKHGEATIMIPVYSN
jgi:hypothetical protein